MITLNENSKIIKIETNDNDCMLLVNRHITRDGHAQVKKDGKTISAHRLSYIQNVGDIPEGMVVRHKCDNPNCINPEHLELGTHQDNVQDRVDRNRSAIGTNNGRAKLTEEQVYFIRFESNSKHSELSKMFSVDSKVIRDIRNFKTWKHITKKDVDN